MKLVPITEAKAKLTELVRDAATEDVLLLRHGRPAAILVAPDRLDALHDQIEELEDRLSVFESLDHGPEGRIPLEKLGVELGMH